METILKIENVSKMYRLGQIGGTTLRDELQRLHAKVHHKEDPTKKIGAKDYNKGETFMALNGVSFEVKKEERIGIIGHNGAGKSTLLKLISRVTAPSSGTISMNGRITSMLEVGTGFHGELTGRENIYMNGAILGMSKKEIDAKMEDIIEFSECRQFIDTPVKRYSSGMYVKLAFSVAAHLDSEIMIMDEVLAVGDMAFRKKCLDKMNDVSRTEGKTILYVSHNMNTIRQLCDRVIVLDHGKVVFDGDVEDGIGVYMGYENNRLPVCYDLEHVNRPSSFHGRDIHISSFRFLDKEEAVFAEDTLRFEIVFRAEKTLENLQMYFLIGNLSASNVGMANSSAAFGSVEQNKTYRAVFSMDISNLFPGKYQFIPDIYNLNQFGNHTSYDHPMQNIIFEKAESTSEKPCIHIDEQYRGCVKLGDIICRSCEQE